MAKIGRPKGSVNKDKPFKEALRMEEKLAEQGFACEAPPGSLRYIARQLLIRAGEDNTAVREIGDRFDGKPAQAVELSGDPENPLHHKHEVEVQLVDVSKLEGRDDDVA